MSNQAVQAVTAAIMTVGLSAGTAFAQSEPAATPAYTLTTFATAPKDLSAPDSIAVVGKHVFVGYGDGHAGRIGRLE